MKNSEIWQKELEFLKAIIDKTELVKTTKWGSDVYTVNNGNVLLIRAFKNYVSLWFFNGVFLKDPYQVLENAQEGKTKAMRHWRFSSADEMNESRISVYIEEAIENEKNDLRWKPEKSEELEIPDILVQAFTKDHKFKNAFDSLPPFKQKEYVEHLSTAKREATQIVRLEKIKPMVLEGQGLNDKYRK
ncbi:DUF1801 domain-containing protein [uncultured Marivirga sp.]|uniref:YdeI/OmpD-associated family protein n=1 Tax=uncultured Marivirga sp. TaxID=1123707 RepID=UPI0030EE5C6C|tara:strand:- start:172242 stop:172805 length:564 start_codon:yes stop_codon:yes gene_type:complete